MADHAPLKSGDEVLFNFKGTALKGRLCGPPDDKGRWLISVDYGGGYLVPEHLIRRIT